MKSKRTFRIAGKLKQAVLVGVLASVSAGVAAAEQWPSQPLRMLVGFAAGGANDILARLVAKELSVSLGQPVVVENRAGAGGMIAADLLAKAAPNGYTLLLGSAGTNTVAPNMAVNLNYDPRKDLAPVSLVADSGNVLLVNKDLPVNNVKELVELAKKEPGTLNYASSGNGSTLHLAGALFAKKAGVDIVHVPYRGNSQAMTDLSAGQVQMSFSGIPPALQAVQGGQVRMLAVTMPERSKAMPDVPTVAESGVPGYSYSSWYGLFTTGGTDPAIVERLAEETAKILKKPEIIEQFMAQGVEPVSNTPAEFAAQVDSELTFWGKELKELGISAQ